MQPEFPPDSSLIPFEECYAGVLQAFSRVPVGLGEQTGPMMLFNGAGSLPPLFWCFNDPVEPVLLAHKFGPAQPIYAMHSLNRVVSGIAEKYAYTAPLAVIYARHLLELMPAGPILLGGNCQSAPLVEVMAHRLIGDSGRVPLLMTLEHVPSYCYPGPLLMMFGSDSPQYNPFLRGEDPLQRWEAQHARFAWATVTGGHGRFFLEPGISDLIAHICRALGAFCATGTIDAGEYLRDEAKIPCQI